jgi:hypothetical protein
MAEMFLLQATIESAAVIGGGFSALGRQIGEGEGNDGLGSWGALSSRLQRIAGDAMEPYTSRYKYFRDIMNSDA